MRRYNLDNLSCVMENARGSEKHCTTTTALPKLKITAMEMLIFQEGAAYRTYQPPPVQLLSTALPSVKTQINKVDDFLKPARLRNLGVHTLKPLAIVVTTAIWLLGHGIAAQKNLSGDSCGSREDVSTTGNFNTMMQPQEVLVQWQGKTPEAATCESMLELFNQFPEFNLEDKVVSGVGGIVRITSKPDL